MTTICGAHPACGADTHVRAAPCAYRQARWKDVFEL